MAKRKRLSPAQDDYLDTAPPELETKAFGVARMVKRAPIAQVAGDAATASALRDLADEIKQARDDGRLVQALPLDQVDAGYLVRDRMMADEEELQVLMQSLRARGQQTPIEVVELGEGQFGLISGWRRLTALRRLAKETGEDRFGKIQALIRRPETAEAAYTAMVEENEIRVGLSYYERARIAAKAVEQGVFPHERAALQDLFSTASRAKRSKIGSFLKLYQAADDLLRYPTAINERLGVALARAFEADPDLRDRLGVALRNAAPDSAEAEIVVLEQLLRGPKRAPDAEQEPNSPVTETKPDLPRPDLPADDWENWPKDTLVGEDITVRIREGVITLTGASVNRDLHARLLSWLSKEIWKM